MALLMLNDRFGSKHERIVVKWQVDMSSMQLSTEKPYQRSTHILDDGRRV
jgi:hypothetical protein